jgi:triphosphoribosyl-dephospho-CoA synthase
MRLAAPLDRIGEQYESGFATVLAGAARLAAGGRFPARWEEAVIDLHLWLMSEFPDTLIARKCGATVARESSLRARAVLEAGWPDGKLAHARMVQLDAWLRADGNRRNPGTSADLVAASLFAGFRNGHIDPTDLAMNGLAMNGEV